MIVAANSQTLFEIGIGSYPWNGIVQPIYFLVIGLIVVRHRKGKTDYKALCVLISLVSALAFIVIQSVDIRTFMRLRNEYISGKSMIADGIVENYQPAHLMNNTRESFSVHGVEFKYTILDGTPCFHDSPLQRIKIHDGLNVRIYYSERCIQRIDTFQQPSVEEKH